MIGLSATGATTRSSPRIISLSVGKNSLPCVPCGPAQFTVTPSTNTNARENGMETLIVVAIDIGGTFTDLVGFDDTAGRFVEAKSLTTPAQLVQGIVDCIRKSGLEAAAIDELIHGSTIAINTLIERKGAKT